VMLRGTCGGAAAAPAAEGVMWTRASRVCGAGEILSK